MPSQKVSERPVINWAVSMLNTDTVRMCVKPYDTWASLLSLRTAFHYGKNSVEAKKTMALLDQIASFLLGLVPYLNAGTLTLILSLGFERLGFKISKREFKRKPMQSLFWGLGLLLISSLVAVTLQSQLVGFEPLLAFFILFAVYLVLTQV